MHPYVCYFKRWHITVNTGLTMISLDFLDDVRRMNKRQVCRRLLVYYVFADRFPPFFKIANRETKLNAKPASGYRMVRSSCTRKSEFPSSGGVPLKLVTGESENPSITGTHHTITRCIQNAAFYCLYLLLGSSQYNFFFFSSCLFSLIYIHYNILSCITSQWVHYTIGLLKGISTHGPIHYM